MRAELSEWKIAIDLASRKVEAFSFFHRRLSIYFLVDKAQLISSSLSGSYAKRINVYLRILIYV